MLGHIQIIVHVLLLTHCISEINAGFLDSWFGSEPDQLIEKNYPPRFNLTRQPNATKPTEPSILLKPDLEDERHKEETTPSTQEIDETNTAGIVCIPKALDVKHKTTSTISNEDESGKKGTSETIVVKHKPVTITSTIMETATKYETVFPFCLIFEQVSRVCDGTLVTIEPTSTIRNDFSYEVTENVNEIRSVSKTPQRLLRTKYENVVSQSSDYDYEFESLQLFNDGKEITIHEATPRLMVHSPKTVKQSVKKLNVLHKYEYIIQSEIFTVTTTLTTTDMAQSATIVGTNCIPREIPIPLCTQEPAPFPKIPKFPIKAYP